ESICHFIEGRFAAQDGFIKREEKSFGGEFARSMNNQGTLDCQRVEFHKESIGAVGGLETAKVIEHNKPADLLVTSRKK
ncbi:MAG: hypothetical protein QNL68_20835, partial [Akkermansiaceae bacterium]